ncbi:MAG: hypothetical protein WKF84_16205 [Pyrinomonadaceae bacterium]
MQPVLFDTSIYITALRQGDDGVEDAKRRLWFATVVKRSGLGRTLRRCGCAGRKRLAKFERDFVKVNRLLVPEANEWSRTGAVLAQIGEVWL